MKKPFLIPYLLTICLALASVTAVRAETYLDLEADSAILIDEATGRVLYDKDAYTRMYPASMTKVLTALVALDYLGPDEIVQVGSEIHLVPPESSLADFVNGEYITVTNLMRGLIIKSGNEVAIVIALATARRITGQENISYSEAEKLFCKLMNERAAGFGALDTHFTNPHGYHNNEHYTTAYDMAIICREALKNDVVRQIVAEEAFRGSGADDHDVPSFTIHDWKTHNELLLTSSAYYYPYATGIKTGFTDEAGYCIGASAERDNKRLIAIMMNASEYGRLTDAVKLFNYGFGYYAHETVYSAGDVVGTASLYGSRMDQSRELGLVAAEDFNCLIAKDELEKVYTVFTPYAEYAAEVEDQDEVMLAAPIEKGTIVGTVNYMIDDSILFTSEVLAENDVAKRDVLSNIKYYVFEFFKSAFTLNSLPYVFGGIGALIILIAIFMSIRRRRASRRSSYFYGRRHRRY